MKKTVTVNLGGTVYNIDEDAYVLLDNYLKNLRIHFEKETDGDEIVRDMEARIAELLQEDIGSSQTVITIGICKAIYLVPFAFTCYLYKVFGAQIYNTHLCYQCITHLEKAIGKRERTCSHDCSITVCRPFYRQRTYCSPFPYNTPVIYNIVSQALTQLQLFLSRRNAIVRICYQLGINVQRGGY